MSAIVLEYDDFIISESLNPDDLSKDSTSISISANKLKYIKYLSYKTGYNVSQIIESLMIMFFEELYDTSDRPHDGIYSSDKPIAITERLDRIITNK